MTQPTKVAGTLRRAVRSPALQGFQVDGTWKVPTTLTFVSCVEIKRAGLFLIPGSGWATDRTALGPSS